MGKTFTFFITFFSPIRSLFVVDHMVKLLFLFCFHFILVFICVRFNINSQSPQLWPVALLLQLPILLCGSPDMSCTPIPQASVFSPFEPVTDIDQGFSAPCLLFCLPQKLSDTIRTPIYSFTAPSSQPRSQALSSHEPGNEFAFLHGYKLTDIWVANSCRPCRLFQVNFQSFHQCSLRHSRN